jgi:hypothetical protein
VDFVIIDDLCQLWEARTGGAGGRIRPPRLGVTTSSRRCRHELHHPDQVVGGRDEVGPRVVAGQASVATLPLAADRFTPTEDILDAVAIAWRAWGGLAALVAVASLAWMAVGEPALEAATTRRDTLEPFALAAAAHFAPGHPLAFYGSTVRTVVVYVGRPIPSLARRPDRIAPGQGVIALEAAHQALATAGRVGPPLASATGRVGALERATLVLAEGTTPP